MLQGLTILDTYARVSFSRTKKLEVFASIPCSSSSVFRTSTNMRKKTTEMCTIVKSSGQLVFLLPEPCRQDIDRCLLQHLGGCCPHFSCCTLHFIAFHPHFGGLLPKSSGSKTNQLLMRL